MNESMQQINIFQRQRDESGMAIGNVEVESNRAVAQAQGALLIAKRYPRNQERAFATIMETCKRKSFAEQATYAFPRGGQTVSGASIRLAEELARAWGNIDFGITELSQQMGFSEMEVYAWDLETNTKSVQRFTVQHKSLNKSKSELTDPRDIYERTANDAARRLRARILAILPPDLVEEAEAACKRTIIGNNTEPAADRSRKMMTAFGKLGINIDLIESRLGHAIGVCTPEEFGELQQIYCSLRDNHTKTSDWFKAPVTVGTNAAAVNELLAKTEVKSEAEEKTPRKAPAAGVKKQKAEEPKAESGIKAEDAKSGVIEQDFIDESEQANLDI